MKEMNLKFPTKEELIGIIRRHREFKRRWQEDVNKRLDMEEKALMKKGLTEICRDYETA